MKTINYETTVTIKYIAKIEYDEELVSTLTKEEYEEFIDWCKWKITVPDFTNETYICYYAVNEYWEKDIEVRFIVNRIILEENKQ